MLGVDGRSSNDCIYSFKPWNWVLRVGVAYISETSSS